MLSHLANIIFFRRTIMHGDGTSVPVRIQTEILDATLRDGSYAVAFQLDEKFVIEFLRRINDAPIQKVEIGHGIGVEAERAGITPSSIDLQRWCEIASSELTASSWGMFAQPEFSRLSTLAKLSDQGMSFIRIGMEAERVSENLAYIQGATEVCGQVFLNLIKTSATPADELPSLLSEVTRDIAGVYAVDSYGSMLPSNVHRYVTVLADVFPVVGFHGHDNLGMANANSIAAAEAGAAIIDGTLDGIGRGAGNAETESLAGIFSLLGDDRYDYKKMAELAEFCRNGMDVLPEDRNMQVLGGVIGIHSGLFPLINRLCAESTITPATLMETAVRLAPRSVEKTHVQGAARKILQTAGAAS
jgi:4-hydroxy 2-oxovalerate aldolase